jgi:hypothetical protein
MFISEGIYWIYFFHILCNGSLVLIILIAYVLLQKTRPDQLTQRQQDHSISNSFQNINRFSTNPVRQISTTESIYSFETALQNSTMIVQEKNETLEFKLPTYDEILKGKQNQDAFLVMDDVI